MPKLLFLALLFIFNLNTATANNSAGALIFKVNCSQCHGALGLGDGYYPGLKKLGNTNLLDITKDTSKENLMAAISSQSLHKEMGEFKSINASMSAQLLNFLQYYFENPNKSFILLNNTIVYKLPNYSVGELTYKRRCVICHGIQGNGKGRLSKIIKNPSPYDLRISYISDGLLRQIIEDGGIKQGRNLSDKMPGFKHEMSNFELESVMLYVKTFRTNNFVQRLNSK